MIPAKHASSGPAARCAARAKKAQKISLAAGSAGGSRPVKASGHGLVTGAATSAGRGRRGVATSAAARVETLLLGRARAGAASSAGRTGGVAASSAGRAGGVAASSADRAGGVAVLGRGGSTPRRRRRRRSTRSQGPEERRAPQSGENEAWEGPLLAKSIGRTPMVCPARRGVHLRRGAWAPSRARTIPIGFRRTSSGKIHGRLSLTFGGD